MQAPLPLKILFVINPISGGKEKRDWEEQIRSFFKASPHTMEFFLLNGESDEASVGNHIERVAPDRVVAVGGDGTVRLVAEQLLRTGIPLAIIPGGSANGMARELGIPADVQKALELAVAGEVRPVDAVRIGDELCIHLADLGMNAMVVKYFEGYKQRGMWGYTRALARVAWQKQKMQVTITANGETVKRNAYMVVIANARKYGTGGNINPSGDVGDGKFEVVILRRINLFEILKSLLSDRDFDPKKIEVIATEKVEIRTRRRSYFQIDGEYKGRVDAVTAKVEAGALQMVVPG